MSRRPLALLTGRSVQSLCVLLRARSSLRQTCARGLTEPLLPTSLEAKHSGPESGPDAGFSLSHLFQHGRRALLDEVDHSSLDHAPCGLLLEAECVRAQLQRGGDRPPREVAVEDAGVNVRRACNRRSVPEEPRDLLDRPRDAALARL